MSEPRHINVEELARLLKPWQIDWEMRTLDTPWSRYRRLRRTGL